MKTFDEVMKENPVLNLTGMGRSSLAPRYRSKQDLNQNRQSLWEEEAIANAACQWVQSHLQPKKTNNARYTSYSLKHLAESDIGYLPNGVFIAAMLMAGFKIRDNDFDLNPSFNVSTTTVKNCQKEEMMAF